MCGAGRWRQRLRLGPFGAGRCFFSTGVCHDAEHRDRGEGHGAFVEGDFASSIGDVLEGPDCTIGEGDDSRVVAGPGCRGCGDGLGGAWAELEFFFLDGLGGFGLR